MNLISEITTLCLEKETWWVQDKETSSAEGWFKDHPKDVFRTILMLSAWAKLVFSGLDDNRFDSSIKMGKETLCIPEFGGSISKLRYNVSKYFKESKKKELDEIISEIRTSSLDSVSAFSKLIKWLANCKIITFGSRIFTNITMLGAIAFTASSIEKVLKQKITLTEFEKNKKLKKRELLLRIAIKAIPLLLVTAGAGYGLHGLNHNEPSSQTKYPLNGCLFAGCIAICFKLFHEVKELRNLESTKQKEKKYHYLKTVNKVSVLVFAIFITLKTFSIYVVAPFLWTLFGTIMLITDYYANDIKKKHKLEV